eukprot:TRINITY_DN64515_c0_g1_i1.p1 TRINITY_DN64515_c0_g1~~TRINITY_DN64515_c0_g1_i1.p1  ORF type:complete len:901 (+),score=81.85 TRINITY_DN64515_c0_g1_i1:41-2743(+)
MFSRRRRGSLGKSTLLRCVVFIIGITYSLLLPKAMGTCVPEQGQEDCTTVEQYGDVTLQLSYPPDHIADKCDSWVLVPAEMTWPRPLLGFLFLIALLYCFLGIAIIADMFMGAIEMITSEKEEIVFDPHTEEQTTITITVWNETVANLTLLALGSSAPEILLSVIETVTTLGKEPGELGAATIVGSAAYNLLVISGVCMAVVDKPKKVKQFGVFVITSIASLFAYIWMYICLVVWSEDVVTLEEAFLTFGFFPLLVLLSWAQDRRWKFGRGENVKVLQATSDGPPPGVTIEDAARRQSMAMSTKSSANLAETRRQITKMLKESKKTHKNVDIEHLASSCQKREDDSPQRVNKGVYKINALRMMAGRGRVLKRQPSKDKVVPINNHQEVFMTDAENPDTPPKPSTDSGTSGQMAVQSLTSSETPRNYDCTIAFSSPSYSVWENAGNCTIVMERTGGAEKKVTVYYHTEAGTAKPGENYKETSGTAIFEPGVMTVSVNVPIIDNVQYQPDQRFYLIMTYPTGGAGLGDLKRTQVTIIDDDLAGVVGFEKAELDVVESIGVCILTVVREDGSSGNVSVNYYTRDGAATSGLDYTACSGTLQFGHGETVKTIMVPITDDVAYEKREEFYVELSNPQGGCTLSDKKEATVWIVSDEGVKHLVEKVLGTMHKNKYDWHTRVETHTWAQQFRAAMIVGDPEDPDVEPPGHFEYFMHFLTFLWKVIFAIVPPTSYAGGWAAFFVSLIFIGIITAVVAEFASMFGCLVGLKDGVTAITFVALGTSLPDTFASKQAAEDEDHADAAIGNVTGSNSVNVFLGLGLPWVIGSIWAKAKGIPYDVPAGDLAFSVIVFTICACLTLGCMFVKRFIKPLGASELGGPGKWFFAVFFVLLWVVYILLSSLRAYGHI